MVARDIVFLSTFLLCCMNFLLEQYRIAFLKYCVMTLAVVGGGAHSCPLGERAGVVYV